MRADLYEEMYKLEEGYWWHVAKRRLVKSWLDREVQGYGDRVYVDIGCGTGKMLEEMTKWRKWKKVLGLDGASEALGFCRKRGVGVVKKADFEKKLPLGNTSVDVISSLDVVEHIRKDTALIREFYRVLKPGGLVIVTVPAYKWLWTYWDDILKHKRRYTGKEIRRKFERGGFEVVRQSYFYSYLLPVAMVFRLVKTLVPKRKLASDFIGLPAWANGLMLRAAQGEEWLLEKRELPIGLSVVCLARKSE